MAGPALHSVLKPGQTLNNTYKIESLIGAGGAGEVYRARNTHSGQIVAIKVLLAEHARDRKHLERLRRELKRIPHPAVVQYLDMYYTEEHSAEELDGLHYIAMEYVDGSSLATMMRGGAIAPDTLVTVAETVLGGLEACHDRGVFHQDISPDNIILRDGEARNATLIDFGIAKDVRPDAKTVVGQDFAGKYEYAAPEQFDGKSGAASDLYSLGATLLAAARGNHPGMGQGFADAMAIKLRPLDVGDLPEPLAGLVNRLSAPRPENRPESAREALDWLHAQGRGDRKPPPPPPPLEPLPKTGSLSSQSARDREEKEEPPRRGRGLWLGLTALAAAAFYVFMPRLPDVSPYTLEMARGEAGTRIEGHAPSEEEAGELAADLDEALGVEDVAQITAADGAPNENWSDMALVLADVLALLDEGTATLNDDKAGLSGTAPTPDAAERVKRGAEGEAQRASYDLTLDLDIAPQILSYDTVRAVTEDMADCGPLSVVSPENGDFAPGERVVVEGSLPDEHSRRTLKEALDGIAEGRPVNLDGITLINSPVCRVRTLLPPGEESDIRILYTSNRTGERVVDDYFDHDDVPVVDVTFPDNMEGFLHAFVIDNESNTLHLRPAPSRDAHALEDIGETNGGRRVVRLMFPPGEVWDWAEPYLSFNEPYGDMRVYAVVTRGRLFDVMRGNMEEVPDFVPDLASALADAGSVVHAERALRVDLP